MIRRSILIMSLFFSGAALTSWIQVPISYASTGAPESKGGAIIVELFTSEGCSSCPPADNLLQQISGKTTKDRRRIITLSEHVTYWNHLGWSDPFSNDVYTQRQEGYGRRFSLDSVYTPQMVIDGKEQLVGNDWKGLERLLNQEHERQSIRIRIIAVDRQGDDLLIAYSLIGSLPGTGADLMAVIVDDEDKSNVARGENSGRILTHVSVARSIKRFQATASSSDQQLKVPWLQSDSRLPKQNRHLILFAQEKWQGRVLGADDFPF
jgi:hypothetical protein